VPVARKHQDSVEETDSRKHDREFTNKRGSTRRHQTPSPPTQSEPAKLS